MKRHVDFLALLYIGWGAIFMLVALAGFALTAGAAAIAVGAGPVRVTSEVAASLTAITIGTLAALALAWGGLHVWLGGALRRYRPWARLGVLGLALVNLIFLPFGTGLGIYAGWVLLTDEGRQLFLGSPGADPPSPPASTART
ncbi:MAG: hypothetical protein AB1635_09365 [Acidobacteriota bacterium]